MAGEDLSSTDIHLACNDSLLVGQVAEITQVDPNDNLATSRVHHRKLQVRKRNSANMTISLKKLIILFPKIVIKIYSITDNFNVSIILKYAT